MDSPGAYGYVGAGGSQMPFLAPSALRMPPTLQSQREPFAATKTDPTGTETEDGFLAIGELRKQYEMYLYVKHWEVAEKRLSRHYYHGDQWTADELRKLKARNQLKVTKNRVKKKINGVVGLVERMRQDPKAYARTPRFEGHADLATMCIRYVLDNSRWEALSSKVANDAAREGIGGIELGLKVMRNNDYDVTLTRVHTDTFFYDPRSFDPDFGDAMFEGTSKWVDLEIAKMIVPEKSEELQGSMSMEAGTALAEDNDRSVKWISSDQKRIRLVDQWYFKDGEWRWCLHTYGVKLMEGVSPFVDEDDKTISKFHMVSAYVDHDGDRYGFFRDMKDTQDEINHRYSKALHLLNTRRLMARRGSIDVEKVRRESIKADGVIEWDSEKPEFDDARQLADMQGQLLFLEDAKKEIDNFGPNPQLLGQTVGEQSGRAIKLLQEAGIAELGSYIIDLKDWKLRVYRNTFLALKKWWTMERWIKVTDPDGNDQLVQINGLRVDPMQGPMMVNNVAQLDVNIIIDEGADTITTQIDTFDQLVALAGKGANIPPELMIELSQLPPQIKKKWMEKLAQENAPDPQKEELKKLAIEDAEAEVAGKKAKAIKDAIDALTKAPMAWHPLAPQLDQATLGLGDYLENEQQFGGLPTESGLPGGVLPTPGGPPPIGAGGPAGPPPGTMGSGPPGGGPSRPPGPPPGPPPTSLPGGPQPPRPPF